MEEFYRKFLLKIIQLNEICLILIKKRFNLKLKLIIIKIKIKIIIILHV